MTKVKIKDIKTYPLGDALTNSEDNRVYLDAHVAQMTGKGLEEAMSRIKSLPMDRRYLTRVINNLDVALADMDSETARFDINAMPTTQAVEVFEKMRVRLSQLGMLTKSIGAFIQERATES